MEAPPSPLLLLAALPLGLRPADLADILLAAAFIYGLIRWLRQSTSPRLANRIVVAVLLLAALYATARHFEMALLEMLVVVSLLLVGLGAAVFFQGDIQRTLDRLLLWRWRRPAPDRTPPLSPVGALCEAVGALVSKRQGALIALRGNEPWSRQIDGGVRLEGLVSVPLLLSIFDPPRPGTTVQCSWRERRSRASALTSRSPSPVRRRGRATPRASAWPSEATPSS